MSRNTDRIIEVGSYRDEHTADETAEEFGLSLESVKRYYTYYKDMTGEIEKNNAENVTIKKLLERYTPQELKAIAEGKSMNPEQQYLPRISFAGDIVAIGFVTDTHIGSKYFDPSHWDAFLEECYRQDASMILHGGDLIDGMSNRPDHIYGLTHIGFSAQMDYAEELLRMSDLPVYIIDGNHDRYGIKSNGLFAVPDVAKRMDHVHFLGHDNGIIEINGTDWMLWHGEDGSSYATSYRLQKVIEAFTGGEKPNVLLAGHVHKHNYIFDRNVHAVSGGALCKQSNWMKSKRLANHTGFHIIKACIADNEIKWFEPRWYPFYV